MQELPPINAKMQMSSPELLGYPTEIGSLIDYQFSGHSMTPGSLGKLRNQFQNKDALSQLTLAPCLPLYICNFSPRYFGPLLFLFQINDLGKTWKNMQSILQQPCSIPADHCLLSFNGTLNVVLSNIFWHLEKNEVNSTTTLLYPSRQNPETRVFHLCLSFAWLLADIKIFWGSHFHK